MPIWRLSRVHLLAMAVSTVLGLAAGSAFLWAAPRQAWGIFLAGFLWMLIVATATALVRCVRERLGRGEWRRGLALGCEMTFPPTTLFLLGAALASAGVQPEMLALSHGALVASKPDMLTVAPLFYTASLVMALVVGPLYVLTSPFKRRG